MKISEKYDWGKKVPATSLGVTTLFLEENGFVLDIMKTVIVLTDRYVDQGAQFDWYDAESCPGALFTQYLTGIKASIYDNERTMSWGAVVSITIAVVCCDSDSRIPDWETNWPTCRRSLMDYFDFSEDDIANHRQFV